MTVGTLKTQGTELFFANPLTTAIDLLKVACPTGITGLGGPADQLDDTCLDSTERTFKQGLKNPGAITVPVNFIPSSPSHQALIALYNGGQTVSWLIAMSDGTTDPTTLNSAQLIVPPANRSSIRFDGYVSDFNIDIATNEIVRATVTIQRSGAFLLTPGPTPT
jgi:hypothetical protein